MTFGFVIHHGKSSGLVKVILTWDCVIFIHVGPCIYIGLLSLLLAYAVLRWLHVILLRVHPILVCVHAMLM